MTPKSTVTIDSLQSKIGELVSLAVAKEHSIQKTWDPRRGSPVFTEEGKYTSRGWTEWTLGFLYGSSLLTYDLTEDSSFLEWGLYGTLNQMSSHLTHFGVHDHGFNNVSTYGNLLRFYYEDRLTQVSCDPEVFRLALKVSGAVQASRWTNLPDDLGYVYSFNGPHSLFIDTIRSMRVLGIAYQMGHRVLSENDQHISLLRRILQHVETTARYAVYWGEDRDRYDIPGRVAHESIFNITDGSYRCPSSQQGYSPFTTWTRGLAWAVTGFAEQLEFLSYLPESVFPELFMAPFPTKEVVLTRLEQVARLVAEYYLNETPQDGIPYWDTGAPGLYKLGDYRTKSSSPDNPYEPVDSSAAAIAAQGFLRLGLYLQQKPSADDRAQGLHYTQAGLTLADALFDDPYLSRNPDHQGLLLHSVYHYPNNWDYIPPGKEIPMGESCIWGDYHGLELALMIQRSHTNQPSYRFFYDFNESNESSTL
jgi:unsaturated chondroitin disaccharide hydrolase